MIRIADINDVGMYHVREHEIGSFGRLDGKSCINCRGLYRVYFRTACAHSAHIKKRTIVNSTGKYGKTVM